ncbi:MAG TPA: PAS domain S-box protein [Burkholderiales bacterium]|nr:PAS domain S-box protein [Burkholderiales bacterium]
MKRGSWIAALLLVLSALAANLHAQEAATKRVLLISTGSRLAPGFILVDQQILGALRAPGAPRIEIYAENLDVIRFPAERTRQVFGEYLTAKYAGNPPDLVMLVFVGNLGVTARVLEDIFPGKPVIVAGYTEESFARRAFGTNVTGFAQRMNPGATLDLMLRLQPGLERIVIIGGTAPIDREMLDLATSAARRYTQRVNVEVWDGLAMDELRSRVQKLSRGTAILYTRLFRDAAGHAFISSEVAQWLGRNASVPVYTTTDTHLGTGVLGGSLASAEAFGRRAGELALHMLAGAAPSDIPFEIRTDTVPMFDARALKRWGIAESALPADSVVRYRQPSAWEEYRWHIAGALVVILIQTAMIAALFAERRHRRRAQRALQESQDLMALATEAGELGLWSRDLAGDTLWMNAPLRAMFGFGADDEVAFADIVRRIHPDDRARVEAEVELAQAEGLPFESEYCIRLPSGAERWVLTKGRTVAGAPGRESLRMGVVLDITQRKYAEEQLRESEARFRTIADTSPVMIWLSGPDARCTFVNNGWLRFTGRSLERELGDGWSESIHRADVGRVIDTYHRAFGALRPFTLDYRLRRHDGEYRNILDHGAPHYNPDGTFLGYIGTCVDVTELKLAEQSLEKQRAFLRQVIDTTPNLIFAKDRAGRFTLANRAIADVFGLQPDDLIGKTDADLNRNPEEVEFFRKIDLEVMDNVQERFIPEEKLTDARGNVRWLQTMKRPLVGLDGRADQVIGAAADITERKNTERELMEQRAQLAHVARVSLMGELAASLAHELNQPLTAILSNARAAQRFMENDAFDRDEIRDILDDVVEATARAAEVIRQMRRLVRKENEPELTAVDLGEVVREVAALVHSDAVMQDIRITLDIESGLPPVLGDRVQLQQVVLNLVMNAFDAIAERPEGERLIALRADHENGVDRVAVCDRGPGLDAGEEDRIFEPFYTTKREGLGMGLSICRSIIRAHGGTLWAANNAGPGATFYFTVPRQDA